MSVPEEVTSVLPAVVLHTALCAWRPAENENMMDTLKKKKVAKKKTCSKIGKIAVKPRKDK